MLQGSPLILTDAKLLHNQLQAVAVQATEIHALIQEEQLARLRHWEQEEKGELECLVQSLLTSQDILKKEKKSIKAAYHTTFTIAAQQQAAYVKAAAEQYKRAHPSADVVDLQTKLVELNNRLLDIDLDIKVVNRDLAQATKRDEQELHSTRLVVMQDTQRILQSEIDSLRSNIFHIETAEKLEAEKRSAEDTGYAALFRVEEQLAKIASRIDKAKQQILFPETKGYQFSTGDSGVYVGCQDLFLSEVSGRFEVRCRRVTKPDGNYAASLFISFGGVSCTTDSAEARMSSRPSGGEKDPSGSHARNLRKSVNVRQSAAPGSPTHAATDKAAAGSSTSAQAAASPPSPLNNHAAGPTHHHTRTGSASSNLAPPPPNTASPARPQHSQQQPNTSGATPSPSHAYNNQQQHPPYPSTHSLAHKEGGLASYKGLPPEVPLPPLPGRAAHEPAHPKGEMVASFLSGLSRKKHKYKKKAEQDMLGSPSRSSSGARGLGDRIEHKFSKFGESMRDGMGLGSKGKLSKLGKLIAIKAPKSSHHREDSKFADDIPSKYFHVDERSEGSGDVDVPGHPHQPHRAVKDPDMFENFLSASAAAAYQPPEEESIQDSPGNRDAPQRPPSNAHTRPHHHRSVSEQQQHQHQHQQAHVDRAGGSHPPSRTPSDSPQVLGDSDEGGMPDQQRQHTSHAPNLPVRPQRKQQSKAERKAEEGMSVAFEEFEDQPARNGVYCQLLGEQVEVLGEKGTKVPDINVKELMIEIELVANTLLEWTPAEGWKEGRPVSLKVLQLEHKMRGSLMNLPQSAIKGLIHLFLPSYLGKAIVASLPPELGQYVVEANEDVHLSGELRLFGQALGTYMADVIPPMVNEALSKKKQQQQQQAAARSRGLLGLSEPQAQAVHKIFSVLSSLIPNTGMVSSNKENKSAPVGGVASICQMCRFYLTYSTSRYWSPLCAMWNRAFQAALLFYGVPEEERFSFSQFMDVRVARLVRKPVRVSFMIDHLKMGVDVDAALNSLKELFARLAKDYHRRSLGHPSLHGVDGPVAPREPLEVQLENLELWHASMLAGLRSFKSRFRSASCTLMAMADREEFQFGAENAAYDGPLHFSVPMNFTLDPDNSFVMDVKLPDQKATMNSVTAIIQDMLFDLSSSTVQQQQQLEPVDMTSGEGSPRDSMDGGEAAALVQRWQEMVAVADPKAAGAAAVAIAKLASGDFGSNDAMAASAAAATMAATNSKTSGVDKNVKGDVAATHLVLKNPVIGQLLARRMNFALKLDEERLAALLASNPQAAHDGKLLGLLMACYGDLFNTALDVGWSDVDPNAPVPGGQKPKCMLKVANNKVTRATATVDSLMFQSIVSPGKAVKMIEQIVIPAMLRFYPRDSSQMRWWHKVFEQLYEYFSKDALDALMCVSARAEVVRHPEPKPSSKLQAARLQAQKAQQQLTEEERTIEGLESWVAGSKLRVVLTGGSSLMDDHGQAGSSSAAAQAQATPNLLGQVAPIYIVNDVNLLTLMDTVKLLMDSSG